MSCEDSEIDTRKKKIQAMKAKIEAMNKEIQREEQELQIKIKKLIRYYFNEWLREHAYLTNVSSCSVCVHTKGYLIGK